MASVKSIYDEIKEISKLLEKLEIIKCIYSTFRKWRFFYPFLIKYFVLETKDNVYSFKLISGSNWY